MNQWSVEPPVDPRLIPGAMDTPPAMDYDDFVLNDDRAARADVPGCAQVDSDTGATCTRPAWHYGVHAGSRPAGGWVTWAPRAGCLVALTAVDMPCEWDGEHDGPLFGVDMPSGYAAFTCAAHLAEAVVASLAEPD